MRSISLHVLKRTITLLLMGVLVCASLSIPGRSQVVSAAATTSWNTRSEFANGTVAGTLAEGGNVRLTASTSTVVTSREDFLDGNTRSKGLEMTAVTEDGAISINEGYNYSWDTSPAAADQFGAAEISIKNGDLLYIGGNQNGVYVIDTRGTIEPSDDTLITRYYTGSSPALASNRVEGMTIAGDLLYISTRSGLSVIDTNGTKTASDDTLLTRYHTGSSPALVSNNLRHVTVDGSFIYVAAYGGGLSVINTQGTESPSDDTLYFRYHTGSTPSLTSNNVIDFVIDDTLLYISEDTFGVDVIDRMATATTTDDIRLGNYATSTNPSLPSNVVRAITVRGEELYLGTSDGLLIVDTKGTVALGDDTEMYRYTATSTPNLTDTISASVNEIIFRDDTIILATWGGMFYIDTHGTQDGADDTIATTTNYTSPALFYLTALGVVEEDGAQYITNYEGLTVLTPDAFHTDGIYLGNPVRIDGSPTTTITADVAADAQHEATLSYRTGSTDAVWYDYFTSSSSFAGDVYGYNANFLTVESSGGVLQLSDPEDATYAYASIDTGKPGDYFEPGTLVRIRARVAGDFTDAPYFDITADDYESGIFEEELGSEWKEFTFITWSPFSHVTMEFYPSNAGGEAEFPGLTLEIDELTIVTPDSMGEWGAWTDCDNHECVLPDLGSETYLQYKLDLETDDTDSSPLVHSVSYNGTSSASGTYTSDVRTFNRSQDFLAFEADVSTPSGTSVSFEYSTDGITWRSITPGASFPNDTTDDQIQWRATLTSTDGARSPVIRSVSITSSKYSPQTSSQIVKQIVKLSDITSDAARDVLLDHFPEYFDNPNAPLARQKATLVLLTEVIRLLKLLAQVRAGG